MQKAFNINWPLFCAIIIYGIGSYLLFFINKLENWPTFTVAFIALSFSYFAYKFSKEKFRLDVMQQRIIIYENIVKFCGAIASAGTLKITDENKEIIKIAHECAHESFRGMGWHKTKILFGKDIEDLINKLNNSYSYLVSYQDYPNDKSDSHEVIQTFYKHIHFIIETNSKLPEIFAPYIYFGNYKN